MELLPFPENQLPSEQNLQVADQSELIRQTAHFSENAITRRMLDAIPGIVMVLNRHRQIVFANRNLVQMLGLECAEALIGRRPGDVMDCRSALDANLGCGAGDSCPTCGALAAIMSGLDGREDVQECLLARHHDQKDEALTLRVWSSPLEFDGDQFTVLAGIDISHERRRRALERTFFHDILNLVGSIRGFAELIELQDDANPVEISQLIQTAAQRVINEIDSQKMLLAAERHELQVNNQIFDSRQFLAEFVELYRSQDQARSRRLYIAAEAVSVNFMADGVILGRILGNMVKNALEASLAGETILFDCRADTTHLTFSVNNSAVIPTPHQPRIFQKDFSTKGVGRGLGTYGMKLLAGLLGASVSFSSNEQNGTTFYVILPLKPVAEQALFT